MISYEELNNLFMHIVIVSPSLYIASYVYMYVSFVCNSETVIFL